MGWGIGSVIPPLNWKKRRVVEGVVCCIRLASFSFFFRKIPCAIIILGLHIERSVNEKMFRQ